MTNPYLQPVTSAWTRAAGVSLLLAATGLAALLLYALVTVAAEAEVRRHLTSSDVIFALILLSLGGFCTQAGYRLACNRPGPNGSMFSRTGWVAIGTGLLAISGSMTYAILAVRSPNANDVQVIVCLLAFGAWCFVLAWRRHPPDP
jgi:heme/copper-type cytochrome/quinol oxidase subunit 3